MQTEWSSQKVTFIGAGNMAQAIVQGLLKASVFRATHVYVADVDPERTAALSSSLGVQVAQSNREAVRDADIVVLAVKPQVMPEVLREIAGDLPREATVVSIAAGLPTRRIEELLGENARVVRVMPNTPALIGEGMAAVCAGTRAAESDLAVAEALFRAVGDVVRVEEHEMDAVTAVSGSGPAYVFYLMEAMQAAALKLGLSEEVAARLVRQTVAGAGQLARDEEVNPALLRARVTSKGGTTAAAITSLEQAGFFDTLVKAVEAAHERSRELSGK